MPKGRIAHIDMAAGIMILWMMLGHIGASQLGYCTPKFVQFLGRFLFFFMPWFFFKSGMFFSLSAARITGGGKLLKPFAVWSTIGLVIYVIIQLLWRTTTIEKAFLIYPLKRLIFENLIVCNGPLWFLLTLFLVINIGNILLNRIHPLLISLIGLIIGLVLYIGHNDYIPDIIANTATGLCFFSIGYWMRNKERNKLLIYTAFVGFIIAIVLFHSPFVDMRTNTCWVDRSGLDYLLWFPACFCGIMVLNRTCLFMHKWYSFPILQFVGRNAMMFYVTHYIVLYTTGYVLHNMARVNDCHIMWILTFGIGLIIMIIFGIYLRQREKNNIYIK